MSKITIVLGCLFAALTGASAARSQIEALQDSLIRISAEARGTVGISQLQVFITEFPYIHKIMLCHGSKRKP